MLTGANQVAKTDINQLNILVGDKFEGFFVGVKQSFLLGLAMWLADKKTKKSIPRPGTPVRFSPKTVGSFANSSRGRGVGTRTCRAGSAAIPSCQCR